MSSPGAYEASARRKSVLALKQGAPIQLLGEQSFGAVEADLQQVSAQSFGIEGGYPGLAGFRYARASSSSATRLRTISEARKPREI